MIGSKEEGKGWTIVWLIYISTKHFRLGCQTWCGKDGTEGNSIENAEETDVVLGEAFDAKG